MHSDFKKEGGFTIIELIIAIFIIAIAVVGSFSAFSMVTILTADTTDRLVATYLGQEGMEVIRNIRDSNWLVSTSWTTYLTNCADGGGCEVDYRTTGQGLYPVIPYSAPGNFLNIDSNGFYTYQSGTKTKFKRKIIITCLPVDNCADSSNYIMKVSVEVSWQKHSTVLNGSFSADNCDTSNNCIITSGTLYNWYNP